MILVEDDWLIEKLEHIRLNEISNEHLSYSKSCKTISTFLAVSQSVGLDVYITDCESLIVRNKIS